MALATLTIACLLFYTTSEYSPIGNNTVIAKQKWVILSVASAIAFLSFYIFIVSHGFATAIVIWTIAFMTLLSSIIVSVKMNPKWLWLWTVFCIFIMLLDLS
ncbi:MAG: hypothetical protein AAF843_19140 [Bacteroidota bacterium]